MGITVKLNDGNTVSVSGEFQSVLAFVKGLPGRAYDGATKTNSVAMSLSEFRAAAMHVYAFEIVGGEKAGTKGGKHGNLYSRTERDAYGANKAAERRIAAEFASRYTAVKAELAARGEMMGMDSRIVRHIERFDIDDQIDAGRIRFSSPERRAAVEALQAWFVGAMDALDDAKAEAETQAYRQVCEEFGIF